MIEIDELNHICSSDAYFVDYLKSQLTHLADQKHPGHLLQSQLFESLKDLRVNHGELDNWVQALENIQNLISKKNEIQGSFNEDAVSFSSSQIEEVLPKLTVELKKLSPWRKGPFKINELLVDTEWQSSMKWGRIEEWVKPDIQGKKVLDIGCSSGYYMYRMLPHEPQWVLGVDPTIVFMHQFLAFQSLISTPELTYLPVGSEALEDTPRFFDTVFCMGILYHRKSPFEFIRSLQQRLKPGGTLIMETLMVPGDGHWALTPVDRYARMRNCFTLPTKDAMVFWLEKFGFKDVEWIHDDWTSLDEQRSTDWMARESLKECLDTNDPRKTVEGYPAPRRCLVKAKAK